MDRFGPRAVTQPEQRPADDAELRPLAPWAVPGEEYLGSAFLLDPERLRGLLFALEDRGLRVRAERFYRAWWEAGGGGEGFERWREALDQRGHADVNRFFYNWAEWRTVLALAAANRLATALLFYE
jgi:hypothetical protein